ncbi:hypothetical protein Slala03_81750 [Streptomyces lavendulae subsp. lavendulae]|uniref:DUF2267 domain-containing protein n=1 Tax=Streptomyces lavendulae TaxID=1914 RepID=UPI0024A1598C|nr:DUF2267 domain-containing protein [Streptomyces lavendulae]GLV88486.1 hypothetical protein Slala03_81750 [Streptomyces lavendulae subsp. lavendulae]
MYDQPRPNRATPAMTFDQMLERVRYEGAYPTRERAEAAVRTVLAALGRQLTGDERVDLAQCLPVEAAITLTAQIPDTQHLTGWGFVKDLAARTGVSPAVARWDTGAVLAIVTRLAGPDLLARILSRLPDGYALLFGQVELRQSQLRAAAA